MSTLEEVDDVGTFDREKEQIRGDVEDAKMALLNTRQMPDLYN